MVVAFLCGMKLGCPAHKLSPLELVALFLVGEGVCSYRAFEAFWVVLKVFKNTGKAFKNISEHRRGMSEVITAPPCGFLTFETSFAPSYEIKSLIHKQE